MRKHVALVVALVSLLSASALSAARADVPSNDDFAAAKVVSSLPYADHESTAGATTQPDEPDGRSVCASGSASVWYRYTPAADDRLDFSVEGSSFGAYVGVYTGTALNDLTLVTCSSAPFLAATAGTTYYFQVGDTDVSESGELVPVTGDLSFAISSLGLCEDCPTFTNYAVPNSTGFAHNAGETSIGVDPRPNAAHPNSAMFLMLKHTVRATWDANDRVAWKVVDGLTTSQTTADPILWTDRTTGRTFVAQLVTTLAAGGSIVAYTDDDGDTWTTTEPAQVNPAWDHQSVGGGPYPAPIGSKPVYPNAIYYCAQLGASLCTRSDDGGLTWAVQTIMSPQVTSCGGLHGHIQVSPVTGTVLVPNRDCGASSGMMASTNAGLTFERRLVPGTKPCLCDPSVAFDQAGTAYFVTGSKGHPVVATSFDDGVTWTKLQDLGRAFGIEAVEMPMATAGSAGRAAVAFYGSQTYGDDQAANYNGVWHLYVSVTYDYGKHWETVDATPDDPVQRGCIWMAGGGNACRNLLDFQGMTIDAKGRILVGYADGCTGVCLQPDWTPDLGRDSLGVIARQTTGKGLLADYDGKL
jgi:hypothetical protein